MFDGLVAYWKEGRAIIPARSHPLIHDAALSLAWMAALRGQRADARAMIAFALKGPGSVASWPRVTATAVMSCVPGAALAQIRQIKQWARSR